LPPQDRELFVDWAVTVGSPAEPMEERLAASRAVEEWWPSAGASTVLRGYGVVV
jgi:hypothetical protein